MSKHSHICRRAIRVTQDPEHPVYLFSLKAKEILQLAKVSRVGRDKDGDLIGYQRPEVRRHIRDITEYLNSGKVVFPNSIILAFDSSVVFKESRGTKSGDGVGVAGELQIPANGTPPGWIVDGQQRATALSKIANQDFPVPVNAFIADDVSLQRDQFFRVNNTKPLPRGLITELLPEIDTVLPRRLSVRRLPSALVDMLNQDPESPFKGLIRRSSTRREELKIAVIADAGLVGAIEESLTTPSGCLYSYRNLATDETDTEDVRRVLLVYWTAVRDTFPEAWGKSPKKSRLMGGAGIRAMGRVMDHVMKGVDVRSPQTPRRIREALLPLQRVCRWTSGAWDDLGGVAWNDIENTSRCIKLLSSVLVRAVLARGGDR